VFHENKMVYDDGVSDDEDHSDGMTVVRRRDDGHFHNVRRGVVHAMQPWKALRTSNFSFEDGVSDDEADDSEALPVVRMLATKGDGSFSKVTLNLDARFDGHPSETLQYNNMFIPSRSECVSFSDGESDLEEGDDVYPPVCRQNDNGHDSFRVKLFQNESAHCSDGESDAEEEDDDVYPVVCRKNDDGHS